MAGGILLAVPIALARLALPFAFVLAGYRLGRTARRAEAQVEASRTLALATAFAACQLGAVAVYAALMLPGAAGAGAALPAAAAGLGGLLRELLTACLVSGALAAFAYRDAVP